MDWHVTEAVTGVDLTATTAAAMGSSIISSFNPFIRGVVVMGVLTRVELIDGTTLGTAVEVVDGSGEDVRGAQKVNSAIGTVKRPSGALLCWEEGAAVV